MTISRRKILAGAVGVGAGGLGFEWWTLRGNLDHRRSPGKTGLERYVASNRRIDGGAEGVVHIGHSTHLIALGGMRFLTDPWFYDPAFGALSHDPPPAVLASELGKLDGILISHDHADHADLRAIAEMDKRAAVIVATEDLANRIRALGFASVSVLAKDQEKKLGAVTVRATEAVHDIYEVGFLVKHEDKCVYFAGDTALHGTMRVIAAEHHPQISILPCDGTRLVGGALPVMGPEDAVIAASRLGSKIVIPSHAEAYFSDPIAGALLASTVKHAGAELASRMAKALPYVSCRVPARGELVLLG